MAVQCTFYDYLDPKQYAPRIALFSNLDNVCIRSLPNSLFCEPSSSSHMSKKPDRVRQQATNNAYFPQTAAFLFLITANAKSFVKLSLM